MKSIHFGYPLFSMIFAVAFGLAFSAALVAAQDGAAAGPGGTAIISSGSPSGLGQTVTFTAIIDPPTCTGTVKFAVRGTAIRGCEAVASRYGVAVCSTTALPIGEQTVEAVYSGDSSCSPHTGTLAQAVHAEPDLLTTTTTLASSLDPSTFGQAVTFTAAVTPSAATGTVNFEDGTTSISGCSAVRLSGGSATCAVSTLTAGTHTITAAYSGDSTYAGSSTSSLTTSNLIANPGFETGNFTDWSTGDDGWASPTIATSPVHSGSYSALLGEEEYCPDQEPGISWLYQQVAIPSFAVAPLLSFWYWPISTSTGSCSIATQSADICSGIGTYGCSPVLATVLNVCSNAQTWTQATYDMSAFATGQDVLVYFSGSCYEGPESTTYTYMNLDDVSLVSSGQMVNPASSTTTVTSSANPSLSGQTVTFTATVAGQYGLHRQAPAYVTGALTWSSNTGCSPTVLSGNPGIALCTTSALPAGSDTVTASYEGDSNHSASSGSITQTVNSYAVTVTSSKNPISQSQSVTFTATMTPNPGSSGYMTWSSNTGCSSSAVSNGQSTCTTSVLPVGGDTITATYSYGGSGSLTETVEPMQLLQNGGFELGSLGYWTASTGGCSPIPTNYKAHSGTYSAAMGATVHSSCAKGMVYLYQPVTIPSNASSVSLTGWYWPETDSTSTSTNFYAIAIKNTSGVTLTNCLIVASNSKTWTSKTCNLNAYIGQTVWIYTAVQNNGSTHDGVFEDDFSVNVTY
jgi:hypothetical protein